MDESGSFFKFRVGNKNSLSEVYCHILLCASLAVNLFFSDKRVLQTNPYSLPTLQQTTNYRNHNETAGHLRCRQRCSYNPSHHLSGRKNIHAVWGHQKGLGCVQARAWTGRDKCQKTVNFETQSFWISTNFSAERIQGTASSCRQGWASWSTADYEG